MTSYKFRMMNSRRYAVTSIAIAFMAVTLLSVPGFGGNAYAAGGVGMSLSVDANAGSHSIKLSGETDRSEPVLVMITAPNGNLIAIDQVNPSGKSSDGYANSYSSTIGVGGNQYKQDGMYTVYVMQLVPNADREKLCSVTDGVEVWCDVGQGTMLVQWRGGDGKYKFSTQVEITSGATSATSASLSSCYGPCNYDPTLTTTGAILSENVPEPTQHGAWNSDGQLTITADFIRGSTTINVSGNTILHTAGADIMLKVIAPNGNLIAIDQVAPSSDGAYSAIISIGGNQYKQDGMYTIVATQTAGTASGDPNQVYQILTASTPVEIIDGHVIPEFGTIAAMILVVAIVAIIAVSAKSKLSLVQRF